MALSCPSPPFGPTAGEEDYSGLIDLKCGANKIKGAVNDPFLPLLLMRPGERYSSSLFLLSRI
jgi:hypothetical protein